MLEPFQFEECEYSAQVRLKMSEWRIDCILRNVSQDKSKRPLLRSAGVERLHRGAEMIQIKRIS